LLHVILEKAIELFASDIHLSKDKRPYMRVRGELNECMELDVLSEEYLQEISKELKIGESFKMKSSYDGSYSFGEHRMRIHAYKTSTGPTIALRIIPRIIPSLETLRLPNSIESIVNYKHGLVIVTGVTGSGKSTTLASIIKKINEEQKKVIITIEDPIEYLYEKGNSLIFQRELGRDVDSFTAAIREAMREDPDILLVGELRDLTTIQNAITLAETGHLVFATLHTKNCAETFDRMIDVFPADQQKQIRLQISSVIQAIVSQKLIVGTNNERLPICELMYVNDAIRNLIRESSSPNAVTDQIQMNHNKNGSQTFNQSLIALMQNKSISYDAARKATDDEDGLKQLMNSGRNN
jgi:twitching motility protein PilT